MKEIKPLTSLRGFAALLVFLYHYAVLFPPSARDAAAGDIWVPLLPIWQQGQVGVSIFFVLSGFLITRIYFARFLERRVSLRLFLVKRIARIWPLFLFFAAIQHAAEAWRGAPPTLDWLVTLSMSQGFFEGLRYRGLPTAWSLTIEEMFYATAPVLFAVVGVIAYRGRVAEARLTAGRFLKVILAVGGVTVALGAAGAALAIMIDRLGPGWQGLMRPHHHWLHATLFGRFPEFAVGVVAAFLHRDPRFARWLPPGRALWVQIACILGIGAALWAKNTSGPLATVGLTYAIAVTAGLLILAMCPEGNVLHRVLSHRVLVFAGYISYGLYLVQLTVMIEPLLAVADRLGPWAYLPALYLLTSAFCAAVYLVVEVPARRWVVARFGAARPAAGA